MAFEWNGEQVAAELENQIAANLEAAAIFLKGKVKEAINRSQPYERYVGDSGVYYHGLDPSEPGEAPKKITGFLQRSIAHKMSDDRQQAFVGSSLPYALYLELGTRKMAARPFLRTTLATYQDTIARIVATGKGS